ncbi:hypothetical protein PP7435_CHR1-1171 [Komagataella phaffii CBS 7435]|uniref:Sterol regulatory element-binding protein cleavage-activating protein n=2 Tax=Komagataella phaffii TaxID=460519 RepID=C4QYA5_KOMPG|nr:Hypothetical protein PAS_chr1-4_0383 [Komagataella phaffii GS115]AOA60556.1 GQ67_01783T0 [Komagataella phaffii]CAH2447051.1 hypothetical protein BQ9382_C1-6165 [Komagataella phaffii CBS 7435]AOA66658.1 GQ68_01798T0 [Komagataella phaffii GS115]CAY68228.1 Hypothetical protein PAS_chr1-4_0383 [Komagataella phaffii GS115]SCV11906.1 hypothetical protein PP7435_CHR1-1171 [Komagataella phaffii CBS 7435]
MKEIIHLIQTIVGIIHSWWIQKLYRAYKKLAKKILSFPKKFILWPVSLVFMLSYPALYSLHTSPSFVFHSHIANFKSINVDYSQSTEHPFFAVKQVWVQRNLDHNGHGLEPDGVALDREFLLDTLDLQDNLLTNISYDLRTDSNYSTPDMLFFLHSPLQCFDNNADSIDQDEKGILKTIRSRVNRLSPAGIHLSSDSLFSGVVKVDGVLKSANVLKISLLYIPSTDGSVDAGTIWDDNLRKLIDGSTPSNFTIFSHTESPSERHKFGIHFLPMSWTDHLILFLAYASIATYFFISLFNLHSVKSRLGLFVAFIVEMSFSLLSAATISSYLFKGIDLFHFPLQALPFVVVAVGTENMFRLINAVFRTNDSLSTQARLTRSIVCSGIVSTNIVVVDLIILLFIVPRFVSTETRQFCIFAGIALIIQHILHSTFFTAVLLIDIRRTELGDLLLEEHDTDNWDQRRIARGSMSNSVLAATTAKIFGERVQLVLYQYILKIRLPLTTTVTGSIIMVLFLIAANIRWMDGHTGLLSASTVVPQSIESFNQLNFSTPSIPSLSLELTGVNRRFLFFLGSKALGAELVKVMEQFASSNSIGDTLLIEVEEPKIALSKSVLEQYSSSNGIFNMGLSLSTVYKFDGYYLLEFLTSLLFILCISGLVLNFTINSENVIFSSSQQYKQASSLMKSDSSSKSATSLFTEKESGTPLFQSRELINGHFLDIIKISTSACPFIISVGIDHKLLVWSPLTDPLPFPTQLPISSSLWPITNVVMSNNGSLIAVFSKSGVVKCWSRLTMSWIWRVRFTCLQNSEVLESFFRKKTPIAHRKGVSNIKKSLGSSPMSSPLTKKNSNLSTKSTNSPRSMSIDSTYNRTNNLQSLSECKNNEFVITVSEGIMYTIDCMYGGVQEIRLSKLPLVCARKLSSPRVNMRLIAIDIEGKLLIATVVNNKWKVRSLPIQPEASNSNKGTMELLSGPNSLVYNQPHVSAVSSPLASAPVQSGDTKLSNESTRKHIGKEISNVPSDFKEVVIDMVPFVGMFVQAKGLVAELVDVQTGTIVKSFSIGQFKKDTFRVFHSTPAHCKFCGCASISSFSIAYTEKDSDVLILHTFSIDNRAKNNICLRVERDVRETRCLGFSSVTEHQHWLDGVERWVTTDLNMLIGVRKKGEGETENIKDTEGYSTSLDFVEGSSGLIKRVGSPISREPSPTMPHLSDIWEGWTMSSNGQVHYFEIPNGVDEGLLIKKIGPVAKFGHKSIVVAFGNVMKILYLGNDNLIEEDSEGNIGTEDSSPGGTNSALSFINRRRNMRMKKYELTHSTNFTENSVSSLD